MSSFLPTLITWLQEYGYPALWGIVFLASLGAPLPTVLVLLASGAFAALGDFNIAVLGCVALSASVCGDGAGYFIGRHWGGKLLKWMEQPRKRRLVSPRTIEQARKYFKRRGAWAIFLSRFLVNALNGVINLLSGADEYPYHRFLLFDVAGEILNAAIPLGLGYVFAASWEAVGDILGAISGLALALLAVILLTTHLIRMARQAKDAKDTEVMQPVQKQHSAADTSPARSISGQLPP